MVGEESCPATHRLQMNPPKDYNAPKPPRSGLLEQSHARERRWPADFEININSRRPVMRDIRLLRRPLSKCNRFRLRSSRN